MAPVSDPCCTPSLWMGCCRPTASQLTNAVKGCWHNRPALDWLVAWLVELDHPGLPVVRSRLEELKQQNIAAVKSWRSRVQEQQEEKS